MSSVRTAAPGHARPAAPTCAMSPPCSRSSPQSSQWPTTARRGRLRDPAPSVPPAAGPQAKTGSRSSWSWLHLLKGWSLRQTRGGSLLIQAEREDLLEILEDRHGRGSTIVTSQVPTEAWHELIGSPTLADAILDR